MSGLDREIPWIVSSGGFWATVGVVLDGLVVSTVLVTSFSGVWLFVV